MAWVKLDDAMPTHPKLMAAGPTAFALDVAGLCYSNKHATDGFIAAYALPAVLPGLPSPKRVAAKLVEVERWVEVDGGWLIHDVHDYQPTAEHQKELSKTRAEVGRKGGSKSPTHAQANGKQSTKQVASGSANPVPSRPVPDPDLEEQHLVEFGDIYPRKDGMKWGGTSIGQVRKSWSKLTDDDRQAALAGAKHYADYVTQPGAPIVAMATTWLNQQRWEQFQEPRFVHARDGPKQLHNVAEITTGGRF